MAVFDLLGTPIRRAVRKCAEKYPGFQDYINLMARLAERSEHTVVGAMGDVGVLLGAYGVYKALAYRKERRKREFIKQLFDKDK